ncbi:MAG: IPT/TIG domain-containing protein, partial [Candidatus Cryptobacteroides sp.]
GLDVRITGKDIDLVTSGSLAGTELTLAVSDEYITFSIPAEANDGAVTLTLANGKTVDTEAIELVKPVISSVSPLELYAGDENVVVTGTDLDLVVSATLGGKAIEIKEDASATSLELVTELTSVSGKVALTLANGVTVESEAEVKVNYHSLVIVTDMPAAQHIGEEVVLKGSNFDLVENIFIGDTKVTKYSLRTAEEVHFLMPWAAVGSYNIIFHLFNGDVETVASPIEVQLERIINTIWEGESYVTWSGGAVTNLSWGGYDWSTVKTGTSLVVNVEVVDDNAVVRIGNGGWSGLPTTRTYPNADGDANLAVGKDITAVSVKLSAADLNELVNNGGLVVCGTGFKVYSIQLITEIPQETTIFAGPVSLTWGDDGRFGLATSYFENLSAGSKMIIYFTQTEAWGQVQINDGWWSDAAFNFPELGGAYLKTDTLNDKSINKIELTLTQEILDHIKEVTGDYFGVNSDYKGDGRVAMVLQGSDWIIDRIAVK